MGYYKALAKNQRRWKKKMVTDLPRSPSLREVFSIVQRSETIENTTKQSSKSVLINIDAWIASSLHCFATLRNFAPRNDGLRGSLIHTQIECLNPCGNFEHLDISRHFLGKLCAILVKKLRENKIKKLPQALINKVCMKFNEKCLRMSKRV